MDMMKKLLILFSIGTLALGMTACGKNAENTSPSTEQTEAQSQETQTPTTEVNGENGGTAASGTEATTEYMDISAGWSEEMQTIRQAVVDALGENYWPSSQIPPEILESTCGITPDMYDDYMGEMPMISTNVDTLLIIKAKDGKVEAVEKALNDYRDMLVEDTMQYPMNVGKIQASRIQRYGNYVCFVQLGADTTAALESGDEAVITHCQEQNELALEVIGQKITQ